MPSISIAERSPLEIVDHLQGVMDRLAPFVAPDRCVAQVKKWLRPGDIEAADEERAVMMAAEAMMFALELLVSQPSMNGSTAIDRLARSLRGAAPAAISAIDRLRTSRFRLLRLEGDSQAPEVPMQDVVSGEAIHVVGVALPPLGQGLMLFARTVVLEKRVGSLLCALPTVIVPLDGQAFAAARGHAAAGAAGPGPNQRWAEAVFAHVVRHGTLEVPGVNRPEEELEEELSDEERAVSELAKAWATLAGGTPGPTLLEMTRKLADVPHIVVALCGMVGARMAGIAEAVAGYERVLLVMIETVGYRERAGSGILTLAVLEHAVAHAIAAGEAPPEARDLFASLRRKVAGSSAAGARPADDPALERLVQRIQALREKTVEQGCTEQEALAAAEKVAELLDRYGLSLGEIDFRAQPCEGIGIDTNRRRHAPIDGCVPAVGAFFDCRVWHERQPDKSLRYVFFGLRADVAGAHYLYDLVNRAFETETAAFQAGALYRSMAGDRRAATTSFQVGLARGIAAKLDDIKTARDAGLRGSSGRDLVPVKASMVEEEMAKLGLSLEKKQIGKGRRVLRDPFAAGQAAGERFEITPGLTKAA